MLTLYRAPWSTNVQRVRMALAFKGVEAEEVTISYEDRSPVEAVSGQGLVPVLVEEDGAVVTDSMRIVARLDERVPDPPLYPGDPAQRALVELFVEWFDRCGRSSPTRSTPSSRSRIQTPRASPRSPPPWTCASTTSSGCSHVATSSSEGSRRRTAAPSRS